MGHLMRLDQLLCITRLVFHFVVVKSDRVFEELRVLLSTDRKFQQFSRLLSVLVETSERVNFGRRAFGEETLWRFQCSRRLSGEQVSTATLPLWLSCHCLLANL